jgi:hypothetical protein
MIWGSSPANSPYNPNNPANMPAADGDAPTEFWQWEQPPQQAQPQVQHPSWPGAPRWTTGNTGDGAGKPDRRSMIGLFAAIGIVVLLASIVGVIVLSQALSLAGGAPTPQAQQPATLPTATPTPIPTATATATPQPTNSVTFVALDTTTQGNWQSTYGSQGAIVVGDTQNLPGAIQVTPANQSGYTWAGSTSDPRALQKVSNSSDRIAACWYSSSAFTIDINITDGNTYRLALYLLDWDQQNRVETVSVVDPTSGNVLDTHQVQDFANGQYLLWDVRGHIQLQITNASGSINAVVSGLFFSNP